VQQQVQQSILASSLYFSDIRDNNSNTCAASDVRFYTLNHCQHNLPDSLQSEQFNLFSRSITDIIIIVMSLAPFFEKPPSLLNKPDGSVLFECMCNSNPPVIICH
jgi:hypothetical protein